MNEQEESEGNRMRKMIEFIQWKSDWIQNKSNNEIWTWQFVLSKLIYTLLIVSSHTL